jgi:hypothetical protein
MTNHFDERSYSNLLRAKRLFVIAFLSVGAAALAGTALAQQNTLAGPTLQRITSQHAHAVGESARQNSHVRPTLQRITPLSQRDNAEPQAAATPAIEATSALGQSLAACNKDASVQDTFALPGLKSEVTLDRCYKGRAHLICVFAALITEARSITKSYRKIVDAKYPDLNRVDGICQLNPDSLGSDIAGSEDFTKRFAILKSQYEAASRCTASVKQAFQEVVLADMAQPPDLLKSMTDSIDGDFNKVSELHNQVADLAVQMELSKKAMKTLDKIHRAMCMKEKTAEKASN